MSYRWEWGWHAVTAWKPADKFFLTEEELNEWIKEKVAQKLVAEYIKKGYKISVDDVVTSATLSTETKPHRIYGRLKRYIVDAKTTTRFGTDAPVLGSPIEPVTATVILAVISGVISLATVVFYFLIFRTVTNMIYDIGTGVGEALGIDEKAGLGVLFLLFLGIILLWIVGKYFWKRRK